MAGSHRRARLCLAGESYAGIYVPTLARKVVRGGKLNLKGFAVRPPKH